MAMATITAAVRYVALYLRISVDKQGRREGVTRQEKWGRAYAAATWPGVPVRVFADNDVSAFDDDADRPGYDALREAIRRGEVAHIWSVEQTRLEANRRRWVELVADLDDAGLGEIHTNRDGIVRLDEVADIKQILSYHERKRARGRLKDTLNDLADEGRPRGGGNFGYRPAVDADGRKTLRIQPDEAAMLRWAADAILAGWSTTNVCRQLNTFNWLRAVFGQRGVLPLWAGRKHRRGVVSSVWSHARLTKPLRSPATAGLRTHHGEIHRKAIWEPILDEVTWRRVVAQIAKPRTVTRRDGKTMSVGQRPKPARKFLLTGFVFCDLCGHHLTGRNRSGQRTLSAIYFCVKDPDAGHGCSRRSINALPLDADIERRLLEHLQTPAFRAGLVDTGAQEQRDALVAQLQVLDEKRRALVQRWSDGVLSDEEWDIAREGLQKRQGAAQAELAAIPVSGDGFDPDEVAAGWGHLTLDEKRLVLSRVVARIVIGPARPGLGRHDPKRVTVEWR